MSNPVQAGGRYQATVFRLWKLGRLNMAPCQERLNTGCTAQVQPSSSEMKERLGGEKVGLMALLMVDIVTGLTVVLCVFTLVNDLVAGYSR